MRALASCNRLFSHAGVQVAISIGDAQRAESLPAQVLKSTLDPLPPLVQVGDDSFGGFDTRADIEHIAERAFGHHQKLSVFGHQDAQPFADEVIWNLIELLIVRQVILSLGAQGLINWIGEARLVTGVQIGVEEYCLTLLAPRVERGV